MTPRSTRPCHPTSCDAPALDLFKKRWGELDLECSGGAVEIAGVSNRLVRMGIGSFTGGFHPRGHCITPPRLEHGGPDSLHLGFAAEYLGAGEKDPPRSAG